MSDYEYRVELRFKVKNLKEKEFQPADLLVPLSQWLLKTVDGQPGDVMSTANIGTVPTRIATVKKPTIHYSTLLIPVKDQPPVIVATEGVSPEAAISTLAGWFQGSAPDL